MVGLYSSNFTYTGSSCKLVAVVVVVDVGSGSVHLLQYISVGCNVLCAVWRALVVWTVVSVVTDVVVEVVIVRVCQVLSAERVTMCVCGARGTY